MDKCGGVNSMFCWVTGINAHALAYTDECSLQGTNSVDSDIHISIHSAVHTWHYV